MKIAIVGDIHIHAHQNNSFRLEDCLNSIRQVDNYCSKNGINTIFFLGDIYHLRDNIPSLSLYQSYLLFEEISKTKKMYAIAGNHDMPYKVFIKGLNNIRHLSSVMETFYNTEVGKLKFGDCTFWMLHCIEQPDKLREMLSYIKKQINSESPNNYNVLCSHLDIGGFYMDSNKESSSPITEKDFEMFDRVFSGHFHSRQEKGKIIYVGSTTQLTFGDSGVEKGFVVFDTDTKRHEFIPIKTRQFVCYKLKEIRAFSPEEIQEMYRLFHDNIVKIEVEQFMGSEWLITLKNHIEKRFSPKQLRIECSCGCDNRVINAENQVGELCMDGNNREAINNSIIKMAEKWLESNSFNKNQQREVLSVITNEIFAGDK